MGSKTRPRQRKAVTWKKCKIDELRKVKGARFIGRPERNSPFFFEAEDRARCIRPWKMVFFFFFCRRCQSDTWEGCELTKGDKRRKEQRHHASLERHERRVEAADVQRLKGQPWFNRRLLMCCWREDVMLRIVVFLSWQEWPWSRVWYSLVHKLFFLQFTEIQKIPSRRLGIESL